MNYMLILLVHYGVISQEILYALFDMSCIVFLFIKHEVGVVVQVFSAKLIRLGMINIASNSRVSSTHILYELA